MKLGVCADPGLASLLARASYDYGEGSVGALLKPREPEELFQAALDALRSAELPYPVANCFVPGDLKITGPEADRSTLRAYVATCMDRAQRAGVRIIVFGSGGARRIPDGFSPATAHDQLVAFCRMVAPLAHDHGVTVVVEPLNKGECNVLTTVDECARLVNDTAHPGVRLLVDAYHLMRDGDSYEDVVRHGHLLAHAHLATVPNRRVPGAEPCDFSRFFRALADAGYTGGLSIEGSWQDPEKELPEALRLMRSWSRSAGA